MYRIKDLKYRDVYDEKGKKLGIINDIAIDYYHKKVLGLIIHSKFKNKKNFVKLENIIAFADNIIAKELTTFEGIAFNEIKNLDILDKSGTIIGMLEEILIDDEDFSIKGITTSVGFFDKFVHGKRILLIEETILGEENILYFGNLDVKFRNMPHNLFKKEELKR